MAVINLDRVTKEYGRTTAVDGLDLEVESGEAYGFLGPNGAGKSTTINVLLGFSKATGGRAEVFGRDAWGESTAVRERTGILPEGYALYDRLTGREHIELANDLQGADDDPDAILERVGLDPEDRDRRAGGYSTGMTQRTALGMALVGDPDLLVLDEPSSGLDPNGMADLRGIVREELDRGTTVFFSSHILDQVEGVCDWVGILRDGELIAEDTVGGLRRSMSAESRIEVRVDEPRSVAFDGIGGVTGHSVDGTTLRVRCRDPGAKGDVIRRIEDSGMEMRDIKIQDASLEDLFAAYTDYESGESENRITGEKRTAEGPA
ncbi:ABC transporter ATP-binding protein [Halosimplex litoreum]|uniref:ABC transporter ATP-binding protein n=1 Tax=Halosimplex litoreum TaxID=1198301 RepID=A0A7T3KTJ9_9EURY|nr:ABC transporter ATP-binding protein [Halosimplex litoreum]QPV61317.1 ABC transporter ATP-binding protein [Halosimplex litoreum]